METRKRNPFHTYQDIEDLNTHDILDLGTTSLTQAATAAVVLLNHAKPPRERRDYLNQTKHLGFLLLGLIYVGAILVYYLFNIRDKRSDYERQLTRVNKEKPRLLEQYNSDHIIYAVSYRNDRYGNRYSEAVYLTCLESERRALSCAPSYYYNEDCRKIVDAYCSHLPIDELAKKIGEMIAMEQLLYPLIAPGVMLALHSLYKLFTTEKDRLRLPQAKLTDEDKIFLKKVGRALKLDISDNANINDIITELNMRIDVLKGIKKMGLGQRFFSQFKRKKTADPELPLTFVMPKLQLKKIT